MNSQKFAENVLIILHHDNVPIGKFEKQIGMAKGYLSRVAIGEISTLTLDRTLQICESIGEDIYSVINSDWKEFFKEEDRKEEIKQIESEIERMKTHLKELKGV